MRVVAEITDRKEPTKEKFLWSMHCCFRYTRMRKQILSRNREKARTLFRDLCIQHGDPLDIRHTYPELCRFLCGRTTIPSEQVLREIEELDSALRPLLDMRFYNRDDAGVAYYLYHLMPVLSHMSVLG